MFGLSETAADGTVGAFYVKTTPYRDRWRREKIKTEVMVAIDVPRTKRETLTVMERFVERVATDEDKARYPRAWANIQATIKEAGDAD